MLKPMKADLHIHTCLSPCGDLRMSPRAIAEQAKMKEIDILGICDHNSAENVPALIQAAGWHEITVLPGLEITSQEEVHILALFDRLEPAFKLQTLIYDNLPGENDEEAFGMQVVVNASGEVLRFNNKLLIGASTLSVNEVVDAIHSFQGLAIAAHVDRERFSLISQLGFIPQDLNLDALEISSFSTFEEAKEKYGASYPLIRSSDAHFPEDVGKGFTLFFIQNASTEEIKKALLNKDGRRVSN